MVQEFAESSWDNNQVEQFPCVLTLHKKKTGRTQPKKSLKIFFFVFFTETCIRERLLPKYTTFVRAYVVVPLYMLVSRLQSEIIREKKKLQNVKLEFPAHHTPTGSTVWVLSAPGWKKSISSSPSTELFYFMTHCLVIDDNIIN